MSQEFSAHNIILPDGSRTFPAVEWTIAESPWLAAATRVLQMVYPRGLVGRSIVDVGCLEGGYTLEFAKMGMKALGIEVRQSNYSNCVFVRDKFKLPSLNFAHDDVWNLRKYGSFDVSFCCGLLYHLDRPVEFLRLLGELTTGAVILNTHVATEVDEGLPPQLSVMTEHEGVLGRWYFEYDPGVMNVETLERAKWTSWGNSRSFWPTSAALMQELWKAGFDMVFESGDWLAPDIPAGMEKPFYASLGRRMIVGIRTQKVR